MTNQTDKPLTAEDIKFAHLVASGEKQNKAFLQAYPHKRGLAQTTITTQAYKLARKEHILQEVQTTIETKARLARLAEDKIMQALTDEKLNKTTADVAMFMYDHTNGKARQTIEQTTQSISLNIDLTGTGTPQEI